MGYTNSPLVDYVKISPNSTNPRNKPISVITIHHMAGNLSVEACGSLFANTGRQASSNYGIGSDGRVGMYAEEANRSWCSSSRENDNKAVTIEVANDDTTSGSWHVSDTALAKLIDLCVDICQRNGIPRLNFTGDKSGNLTMHKWFAATLCPGPYLESKFPYIAEQVNRRIGAADAPVTEEPTAAPEKLTSGYYRVRKSWSDSKSQLGAYKVLSNAKRKADANPGYSVYDNAGKNVYPVENSTETTRPGEAFQPYTVKVSIPNLKIRKGPGTNYAATGRFTGRGIFTIVEEATGQGASMWGKLKSGAGWISLDDTVCI